MGSRAAAATPPPHSASTNYMPNNATQHGLVRSGHHHHPQQRHHQHHQQQQVPARAGPSCHPLANPQVTSGHLAVFKEAVSALFYERGKEALPMAQIRNHVLAKTTLTESEITSCVKIMLNSNKMLETADFFCLL